MSGSSESPRRPPKAVAGILALVAVSACAVSLTALRLSDSEAEHPSAAATARAPSRLPVARRLSAVPSAEVPVAGMVIDGAGQPFADATIEVLDGETSKSPSTMTDELGRFRLEPIPRAGDRLRISGADIVATEVRWQEGSAIPRILVERAVSVSAVITDDDAPVAGARVWLGDGSHLPLRSALTDADGKVVFAELWPGSYELWAEKGPRVSALVRASGMDEEPEPAMLALAPGSAVAGRLLDLDGRPVAGSITLIAVDHEHAVRRIATAESGDFAIDALPRGNWRAIAEAPGFVAREFALSARTGQESIEMRLPRGSIVRGRVTDDDGKPVAYAALVLHSSSSTPRASSAIPQAARALRWIHPLAEARHLPMRDSRRFGAARDGARPLECGRGHCGVDVGGERGSAVHAASAGVVVTAAFDGGGRAGRFVAIEHDAGLKTYYMHLDDIRADLEIGTVVRAGEVIGTLGATGIVRSEPHLHFALARTEGGRPIFIDPEPLLRRAVVLPRPASLVGDGHRATWLGRPVSLEPHDETFAEPTVVYSDPDGRFTFDGVGPGSYMALARASDRVPATSSVFSLSTGTSLEDLAIVLQAGSTVMGRVLGPAGPIAGALVTASQGEGESALVIAESFSDAQGYYQLHRVSGELALTAKAAGFGGNVLALRTKGSGEVLERDLHLAALSARLAGSVRDPSGFPVRGATVRVTEGPSGSGRRTTTDEHGSFVLEALAIGDYMVHVAASEFPATRARIGTDERADIALAAGGHLDIEVRDRHTGAALAGVAVRAEGPARSLSVTTDSNGQAKLSALAIGTLKLAVDVEGYTPIERKVAIASGRQSERLELGRGATLAGVVRDGNGERVAGAIVAVEQVLTRTDQDGRFRLIDVPTGMVELRSEKDGQSAQQALNLSAGDEYVTLELRLESI